MKKAILLAAAAAFVSTPAMAAPGDTATAQGAATAEVVAPISLTHVATAALDFGTFTSGTTGGSIVVTQLGGNTPSGDVTMMTGSTTAADAFTVGGDGTRTFSITTTGGTVSSAGNTMAFTTDAPAAGALVAGAASFNVGGTLTVGANQAAGVYTGSYDATVTYN